MASNRSLTEVPKSPIKSCLKEMSRLDSSISALRRSSTTASLSGDDDSYAMRKVFFDEIEIREYPQILGDNPAVTDGVPLGLDWDYSNHYKVNLEMYEFTRASVRRKSRKKLMIPSTKRFRTLVAAGYSIDDIGEAILSVEKIKAERTKSVQAFGWNGPLDFLNGAVETMGSAFRAGKKRSSKILKGSLKGGFQMIRLVPSKPKSYSNPAC